MSSATSTEPVATPTRPASSTEPQPLQPWQFFTLAGLIGATIVVFLSQGQTPAGIILLSFVIFGAAAVGVAAWRMFAPLAGADAPAGPQIFGGRTRAALEREKSLVLRAIKDLEFDYAMGKLSETDFAEMGARLRGRAAGLLRQLDAGSGYREAIQMEIDKRIGKSPVGEPNKVRPTEVEQAVSTDVGRALSGPPVSTAAAAPFCTACGVRNETDARFCKACGHKMESR